MKLHANVAAGRNAFTSYGDSYVAVNGTRYSASLIVTVDRLEPWSAPDFAGLTTVHFEELLAFEPEVLLLGTGPTLRFPRPEWAAPLARAGIGIEAMDLQAACRTFNILADEGRRVLAALLLA